MNKGDKLRQMTNEELAYERYVSYTCPPHDGFCMANDKKCYQCWLNYFNTEVETTADEDFLEIGFDLEESNQTYIRYSDAFGRTFEIIRQDIRFKTCSNSIKIWDNRIIDQIRTIADKKRKEVWG